MKIRNTAVATLTALLAVTGCGGTGGGTEDAAGNETITIDLGYLHTLAVDDKLQLGIEEGYFAEEGLDIQLTQFDNGVEASQALQGGSLDMTMMGAVMTSFAAQGEGEIVLLNAIEHATAQLWVQPGSDIESVEDLRGKEVITTEGSTADVFITRALEDVGIQRSEVEITNAGMANAVQGFASGSIEAIALWAPFDLRVNEAVPEARQVASAGDYPDAAVVSGVMANEDWHQNNSEALERFIRGWLKSNEHFRENETEALETVQNSAYSGEAELEDLEHQLTLQTDYTNEEWISLYEEEEVHDRVQTIQESLISVGALDSVTDPEEMIDASTFIEVANEYVSE